jgi:hypothetical protein
VKSKEDVIGVDIADTMTLPDITGLASGRAHWLTVGSKTR